MVIYGTELALWIGIFICGGVFNFLPWAVERSKKKDRDEQREVSLHQMPSSTSVFRTASASASGSDVVVTRRAQPQRVEEQ
jgi:hypothetical protein